MRNDQLWLCSQRPPQTPGETTKQRRGWSSSTSYASPHSRRAAAALAVTLISLCWQAGEIHRQKQLTSANASLCCSLCISSTAVSGAYNAPYEILNMPNTTKRMPGGEMGEGNNPVNLNPISIILARGKASTLPPLFKGTHQKRQPVGRF